MAIVATLLGIVLLAAEPNTPNNPPSERRQDAMPPDDRWNPVDARGSTQGADVARPTDNAGVTGGDQSPAAGRYNNPNDQAVPTEKARRAESKVPATVTNVGDDANQVLKLSIATIGSIFLQLVVGGLVVWFIWQQKHAIAATGRSAADRLAPAMGARPQVELAPNELRDLRSDITTIKRDVTQVKSDVTGFGTLQKLIHDVSAQLRSRSEWVDLSAQTKVATKCLESIASELRDKVSLLEHRISEAGRLSQAAESDRREAERTKSEGEAARKQGELLKKEAEGQLAKANEAQTLAAARHQQLENGMATLQEETSALDAKRDALQKLYDSLCAARKGMLPPAFDGDPLCSRREEIESYLDRPDSTGYFLWLTLGRYRALLARPDNTELACALREVGRLSYQYWSEKGLDADAQYHEAETWANAFNEELNGRFRIRLAFPGQPKDSSWMTYSNPGGQVVEVLGWCVMNANNRAAEKAEVG